MDVEISFKLLLKTLRKHLAIIIVVTLILAVIVALYTVLLVTPMYRATSTSNLSISDKNQTQGANLSTTINMMNTYQVLIESDDVMELACSRLNNAYTPTELRGIVSASYENGGTIMHISAVNTSPENARIIANVVTESAAFVIDQVNWTVVNEARTPTSPESPSLLLNVFLAVFVGLLLSYGVCLIFDINNTKIVSEEQLADAIGVPVLGLIPLVENTSLHKTATTEVSNNERK